MELWVSQREEEVLSNEIELFYDRKKRREMDGIQCGVKRREVISLTPNT